MEERSRGVGRGEPQASIALRSFLKDGGQTIDRIQKKGVGSFYFLVAVIQVQSTAHQTIQFGLCIAFFSKGISANVELQVYSVACC
jgi:hypothetical protein